MRPRKTPDSNTVYTLPGGNEDNDLWSEKGQNEETGEQYVVSEWDFTPAEREAIAVGGRVQLVIHSGVVPPVSMIACIRGSDGELIVIEPDDGPRGSAVLLPVQAEKLRNFIRGSISILETQLADEATTDEHKKLIQPTLDDFKDLLLELRPIGYARVEQPTTGGQDV